MAGRTAVISIRVTEDEKAQIEARAKAKGLTVTGYTRDIVTGFDADAVAAKAHAAVEQQDAALASLTGHVEALNRDITALSRRVRDDRIIWIAATGAVVFLLSVLGAGLGYLFAGFVGP